MRSGRALMSLLAVLSTLAVACGSDSPTAAPTPPPVAATPTPSPTTTPTPAVKSCTLSPMPNCAAPEGPAGVYGCCRQRTDELGHMVTDSIIWLQENRKDLIDGTQVKDQLQFMLALEKRIIEYYGACAAAFNPLDDEIAIKTSNDFSEQYDVLLGDGSHVNLYGYAVTCKPARF